MASTTTSWTENQTLRSAATLAAGSSDTNDIDVAASGYDAISLQINIAHGSSSGVTVELFSSPDSGTTEDDVSLPGGFTTDGTDLIKTLTVMAVPYLAVKITNDDGSNSTGNISIGWAGRKWDTT